jgi:hypothetical protein
MPLTYGAAVRVGVSVGATVTVWVGVSVGVGDGSSGAAVSVGDAIVGLSVGVAVVVAIPVGLGLGLLAAPNVETVTRTAVPWSPTAQSECFPSIEVAGISTVVAPLPLAVTTFVRSTPPDEDPQRSSTISPAMNPRSVTALCAPAATGLSAASEGRVSNVTDVVFPESSVAATRWLPRVLDGTTNAVDATPVLDARTRTTLRTPAPLSNVIRTDCPAPYPLRATATVLST